MVLLDPAKSAEPPIKVLFSLERALRVSSEALREARLWFSLTEFMLFRSSKALEKLFLKTLSTKFVFSFINFVPCRTQVLNPCFQFFSIHLKYF